jgi:hypothetical protein
MDDELTPRTVDSVTEDGINSFVSERLGIALKVKPDLTDGDLFKWGQLITLEDNKPIAVARSMAFRGAVKAGIVLHRTDTERPESVPAERAQWYGLHLLTVYQRYTIIDPN